MKGTERIITQINTEANGTVAEIMEKAHTQSESIRQSYAKKARESYSERIRTGVREGQMRLESLSRVAQTEAKKTVLELKQELIDECFAMAERKLRALPEEQYVELLHSLALRASEGRDGELILNPSDRKHYGKELIKRLKDEQTELTLSHDTRKIKGGLILRRGEVEINCSIESLVREARESMSGEVARKLFR